MTSQDELECVVSTPMPTKWGRFAVSVFERQAPMRPGLRESAVVIAMGNLGQKVPLVRVHSQCFTGEVLGSLRCDCKDQLATSLGRIAAEGCGLVIYEHQEGRGIGLTAKLQAYRLQDAGLDTFEANRALGFAADRRDFSLPATILHTLSVRRVRLLTNNPQKIRALTEAGIEVLERVPCEVGSNPHSAPYLRAKRDKMGHLLGATDRQALTAVRAESSSIRGSFARIDDALGALRAGRMVVVVDDADRKNEGDLTMAASLVTPEAINFMAMHGRGLICLAMTGERLDELELAPMVPANSALHVTAFTTSIDLKGRGVTTGISSHDRAQTIAAAIDPRTRPSDFGRPGHIFPLRARPGGVLERRGQTEAAVDLARLAGLPPAGVICEIINDDGTMARVPDLVRFCNKHDLLLISVADLALYRRRWGEHPRIPSAGSAAAGSFPVSRMISTA